MILPPILASKVFYVAAAISGVFAVTEAFFGQLVIALIAAIPPTGAVIVALLALKKGQEKMAVALDGKLSQLIAAEKGVAKAEGVAQERDRVDLPTKVEVVSTPESPVITKAVKP